MEKIIKNDILDWVRINAIGCLSNIFNEFICGVVNCDLKDKRNWIKFDE